MALIVLVDKVVKSLENGESILSAFRDFSNAFDLVKEAFYRYDDFFSPHDEIKSRPDQIVFSF